MNVGELQNSAHPAVLLLWNIKNTSTKSITFANGIVIRID